MTEKVKQLVERFVCEQLGKEMRYLPEFDVFVVWQCYILGNTKWLISTTLPDCMYCEVTYNKERDEFYLDAYKKFENRCIKNVK